jgi:hypothetical protein
MAADIMTQGTIWSYRDEQGTKIVFTVLFVLAISFLAMIAINRGMDSVWLALLSIVIVILFVVSGLTTGTNIEINRRDGTVMKTEGFFLSKKRKTSYLRMFDTVKLLEKNITVEEGYGVTRYSIVLEGRDASLELLSTDDKQKGRAIRKELIEFLELSKEQEVQINDLKKRRNRQ